MANRNRLLQPEARQAMEQLKMEVANELGLTNYDKIDKGDLPARVNGKVGGQMVKRLIAHAEQSMKK